LKYQERTVAICVPHRPGLFTERYFHHGIDLNAQLGTFNVTSNRVSPDLFVIGRVLLTAVIMSLVTPSKLRLHFTRNFNLS
jgi:hypothetical protein